MGHIVTGDLKVITDSGIQSIICKGPKYGVTLPIDFKTCLLAPYKNFVISGVNESMLKKVP